jgi:hypothetical protein
MKQIIIRQTGPNTQPRFSLNGAGDSLQVAVHDMETGAIETIFTGNQFSEEEYAKQGGAKDEKRHFSHYKA